MGPDEVCRYPRHLGGVAAIGAPKRTYNLIVGVQRDRRPAHSSDWSRSRTSPRLVPTNGPPSWHRTCHWPPFRAPTPRQEIRCRYPAARPGRPPDQSRWSASAYQPLPEMTATAVKFAPVRCSCAAAVIHRRGGTCLEPSIVTLSVRLRDGSEREREEPVQARRQQGQWRRRSSPATRPPRQCDSSGIRQLIRMCKSHPLPKRR